MCVVVVVAVMVMVVVVAVVVAVAGVVVVVGVGGVVVAVMVIFRLSKSFQMHDYKRMLELYYIEVE